MHVPQYAGYPMPLQVMPAAFAANSMQMASMAMRPAAWMGAPYLAVHFAKLIRL